MSDTLWSPRLDRDSGPIYRAIADALERDLAHGVLRQGERLPTHRDLAKTLDVTPLTITRAYREAARRGIIESTVGRGTFIRSGAVPLRTESGLLDLSRNVVEGSEVLDVEPRLLPSLRPIIREADYEPTAGSLRQRSAAAAWMQRAGVDAPPDRIIVTPGAQQAIVAILGALCRPGDTVLAEEVSYPRFGSIAAFLNLNVEPLALDEHGVIPSSFEKKARKAKAAYLVPTFQNPTGSVMPERRRREIAAIATRLNITIIEDDVYGFLLDRAPRTIHSFAPDHVAFLTSISKSLTPSLRLGFAAIPERLIGRVTETCGAMTAFTSSASSEIFAMLVEGQTAERSIAAKRALITRNRAAADRAFAGLAIAAHERSPHLWIELPRNCPPHELADRARLRGIAVAPASSFAVAPGVSINAVRVSIGATTDTQALESALLTLASLIAEPRLGACTVV